MKKLSFVLFILFLSKSDILAQQEGRMETDRPDQTESPFLTKHKYLQAEIGFNIENHDKLKTFVHPTVLWKYGLSERFELRLITESITQETPLLIPYGNDFISGILPVHIGGKITLTNERGIAPKTSLIFHVAAPKVASQKFHASKWAPNFRFVMQNTLSKTVGLGYNIGAEWDGETNTPGWIYTFAPGFNIGKNWYGYIEAFGMIKKNEKTEHAVDGGLAYYFSENTKIDFSGGFGITECAVDNYFAIGFSFRFNTQKKEK
ncbi:MAG: transporter [Chitinophagaceae bacterium]|nr:transporter [Chitinophagaceae bacterium]